MKGNEQSKANGSRLGTFAGVFTPSILTILGIILFLRLGFVTGEAGLTRALIIIALANTISVLTSFSLSAVSTNFEVKGGGVYYLISRTLGAQFGGAIGLVLFLAQSISIAFYAIGFGEAVAVMFPEGVVAPRLAAAVAVVVLLLLAWLGSDWATRFQYVVMALLFVAITAFAVGAARVWSPETLATSWKPAGDTPFWVLFALFFPAVTGFTQGVAMSGDLKDPAKALPLGTFLAVGLSMIVYFGVAVLFAGAVPGAELVSDYGVMRKVAFAPWLIDAGVIAATLSSALASFLGAPRILQSLAADRLVPVLSFFAKGSGESGNPRRGVVLSGAIAAATVAVGDLDLIAPVVSMFFLISYGLLNYATYFESRTKSPSFRPRFRFFHERSSLLGCIACVGAIVALNPTAGAIAFALLIATHQFLGFTAGRVRWADSGRSSSFQRVRDHLVAMAGVEEHARDWRPVILAFSDDPARRERLIRFASWIEGGSGLTTAVRILVGDGMQMRKERQAAEADLERDVRERGLGTFARVIVASDVAVGFPVLLQAAGLGPIRPNTVLLNWFDQERLARESPGLTAFGRYLRAATRQGCNVILLQATMAELKALEATRPRKRRIDVWWQDDASGRLALMLAYLMTRTDDWDNARIRLVQAAPPDAPVDALKKELEGVLDEARIDGEPAILPGADRQAMIGASADASLVFLPFRLRDEEVRDSAGEPFDGMLDELPLVALVLAAQAIDLESQPDEGRQARVVDAVHGAKEAEKQARALDEAARAASREHQDALAGLEKARANDVPAEEIERLEQAAAAAEAKAEQARRRAAKAEVKARDKTAEAESLVSGQESEPSSRA